MKCIQLSTYHISLYRADLRVFRTHWHKFFFPFCHFIFSAKKKNTKSAQCPTNKRLIKLKVLFTSLTHTPDELNKKNPIKLPTKTTLLAWEYFSYWRCLNARCKQLKIFWFLLTLHRSKQRIPPKKSYKQKFSFPCWRKLYFDNYTWGWTVLTRRRLFNLKFASVLIKLSVIEWEASDESQHPCEKSF